MKNQILDEWEEFLKAAYGHQGSLNRQSEQYKQLYRAFVAGSLSLMNLLVTDGKEESDEQLVARVARLHDELFELTRDIIRSQKHRN